MKSTDHELAKPFNSTTGMHWSASETQVALETICRGESYKNFAKAYFPNRTPLNISDHMRKFRKKYSGTQLSEIPDSMIEEKVNLASHITGPKENSAVDPRRDEGNKRKAVSDDDQDGIISSRLRKRTKRVQYPEDEDSQEDGEVYAEDKILEMGGEDGNEDEDGFAEDGAEGSKSSTQTTRLTKKKTMKRKAKKQQFV